MKLTPTSPPAAAAPAVSSAPSWFAAPAPGHSTTADAAAVNPAEPTTPTISPEEGMRYYAAILGHEPTLDPEAPDLLPGMSDDTEGGPPARSWTDEVSRALREEIGRKLQMKLKRRPTWRELMDAMTLAAGRRLDEARRRLGRRDAA